MYAPVIAGSYCNRNSYIFQVFVDEHGQVARDLMAQASTSIDSPAGVKKLKVWEFPVWYKGLTYCFHHT